MGYLFRKGTFPFQKRDQQDAFRTVFWPSDRNFVLHGALTFDLRGCYFVG